ncbi:serine/threonine-protein kinase [Actinokineospora sp. 24-640]
MGHVDGELLAGRYLMGEVLGSGGAARVNRAWDTRLDRAVAVKTFRGVPDTVELRRFDNEIRTLATLSHPGLVEVYDSGMNGRRPYVVLELIEGGTLRDRIAEGPLSPAETARLGGRLAEALAYVHEQGVTHRDVKPSNILLDAGGRPHLVDFGVARLLGSEHITASNQMVGTAAYLAPEQVRGDVVDTRADIYALGLVLLECVTGLPEYQGGDVESAIARLHRPPAIPPDLPPVMVRLLALMTALSPARRPTARACAEALERVPAPADTRVELDFFPWADDAWPDATWSDAGGLDDRELDDKGAKDSAGGRAGAPARRRPLAAALGLVAAAAITVWGVAGSVHSEMPTSAVPGPAAITSLEDTDGSEPPTDSVAKPTTERVLEVAPRAPETTDAAVVATAKKTKSAPAAGNSGNSGNSGKSAKAGKGKPAELPAKAAKKGKSGK